MDGHTRVTRLHGIILRCRARRRLNYTEYKYNIIRTTSLRLISPETTRRSNTLYTYPRIIGLLGSFFLLLFISNPVDCNNAIK